jgi:hypothetical protein
MYSTREYVREDTEAEVGGRQIITKNNKQQDNQANEQDKRYKLQDKRL